MNQRSTVAGNRACFLEQSVAVFVYSGPTDWEIAKGHQHVGAPLSSGELLLPCSCVRVGPRSEHGCFSGHSRTAWGWMYLCRQPLSKTKQSVPLWILKPYTELNVINLANRRKVNLNVYSVCKQKCKNNELIVWGKRPFAPVFHAPWFSPQE